MPLNKKQKEYIEIYNDAEKEQRRLQLLLEVGIINITQYQILVNNILKDENI